MCMKTQKTSLTPSDQSIKRLLHESPEAAWIAEREAEMILAMTEPYQSVKEHALGIAEGAHDALAIALQNFVSMDLE